MTDEVLEHALLHVVPGREQAFEEAFVTARSIISTVPGFRALSLARCLERPATYLLLVRWDSLEAHTEGFRGSPGYQEWKALLHHFYEPFPVVEHFREMQRGTDGPARPHAQVLLG